jgi:hypothetical protein
VSARLEDGVIVLEGACRVEDAETLLGWLQADPSRVVDLTHAEHLHAAVLQILMALGPTLTGADKNDFIRDWITPSLTTGTPIGMTPRFN